MSFFSDTRFTGKLVEVEYKSRIPNSIVLRIDESLQWFVFKVQQQGERDALKAIEALGYSAVIPEEMRFRRVGRCRNKKKVPTFVFKGYVFVGFHPGPVPFHEVLRLPMILGIVAPGGQPSRLCSRQFGRWMRDRDFRPDSIVQLVAGRTPYPITIQPEDRAA